RRKPCVCVQCIPNQFVPNSPQARRLRPQWYLCLLSLWVRPRDRTSFIAPTGRGRTPNVPYWTMTLKASPLQRRR
ncbi:MAG: hypothetical protein ACI30J_08840, partial [Paludibacteraceae bacterium]